MQYEIVKEEDFHVIVIEGQRLMKFKSRRKAARLLATLLDMQELAPADALPAGGTGGT